NQFCGGLPRVFVELRTSRTNPKRKRGPSRARPRLRFWLGCLAMIHCCASDRPEVVIGWPYEVRWVGRKWRLFDWPEEIERCRESVARTVPAAWRPPC